jgi:hypothetical protein
MSSVQIDWIDNESGFEMGRKDGDDDSGMYISVGGCAGAYMRWWWVDWLSRCGLVNEKREGGYFSSR